MQSQCKFSSYPQWVANILNYFYYDSLSLFFTLHEELSTWQLEILSRLGNFNFFSSNEDLYQDIYVYFEASFVVSSKDCFLFCDLGKVVWPFKLFHPYLLCLKSLIAITFKYLCRSPLACIVRFIKLTASDSFTSFIVCIVLLTACTFVCSSEVDVDHRSSL